MRKITLPKITYIYSNKVESSQNLKRAFSRIFDIAKRNLRKKAPIKYEMSKNRPVLTDETAQSTVKQI